MKICKYIILGMIPLIFLLNGCNLNLDDIPYLEPYGVDVFHSKGDKIFNETVLSVLEILDNGDKDALKALFTDKAKEQNDFDVQLDNLFLLYNTKYSKLGRYDVGSSSGKRNDGKEKYDRYSNFPILIDGKYYFIEISITCIDEFNPQNEGITSFVFFSAQDFCLYLDNKDNYKHPEYGLTVYDENIDNFDVIISNEYPFRVLSDTPALNKDEVVSFLGETNSVERFVERFGKPVAEGDLEKIYYIDDGSGETHYLEIVDWTEKTEIFYANINNEWKWIEKIYEDDK